MVVFSEAECYCHNGQVKSRKNSRVGCNVIIIAIIIALKTPNYPQSVTVILPKTCGVNVSQLLAEICEMLLMRAPVHSSQSQ